MAISSLLGLLVLLVPALAFAAGEPEAADDFFAGGYVWKYWALFAAGFATSLTPCVYPMIPIVVGVFGARDDSVTRRKAFVLGTMYVLGMGAMYSSLGVVFALIGKQFNSVMSNPAVIIPLVAFYGALALSMFGFWELRLPYSWQSRLNQVGGRGYGGAFGMGLAGGLTAAPCTGPILLGTLGWVSQTGNAVAGSTLLFTYALGMGILFWVLAVFAVSLPKSGRWMEWIKSAGGITLLVVGAYFLEPLVPAIAEFTDPSKVFLLAMLGVAALGFAVGAIHLSFHDAWPSKLRKGAGVVLMVVGLVGVWNWAFTPDRKLPWMHDEAVAFEQATAEGKGVMIDFGATWCLPCKDLEKSFADPEVYAAISDNYVPLKFDVTDATDVDYDRQDKWNAHELPAVVFAHADGTVVARYHDKNPSKRTFLRALRAATETLGEREASAAQGTAGAGQAAAGEAASVARGGGTGPRGTGDEAGARSAGGDGAGGAAGAGPGADPDGDGARDRDSAEPASPPIAWQADDQAALDQARAQGKHVFIDFTARWCAPCLEMEARTFSDAEVARVLTERYVPVRIDLTDGTDAQAALTRKYGADNLPLMIVLDSQGNVKHRIRKFLRPDELLAQLDALR